MRGPWSQRDPLRAPVLINDRMDRAELAIQRLAEGNVELAERVQTIGEKVESVADKVDLLADVIRRRFARHGNGSGQHPS